MKILALESSAKAASAAVCEEEKLIAQAYQNTGLTHSATLLPMVWDMLKNAGLELKELDALAVTVGPGSFTGLRIGISTVKGLAWGTGLPCAGVSTLEAMAWNLAHTEGTVCCCMDARRGQVYNAVFSAREGTLTRLTPDRAISLEDLVREIGNYGGTQFVVGDGAHLCYNYGRQTGIDLRLAPEHLLHQNAWGTARAALECVRRGELLSGEELAARYLRLSQAERELMEKQKGNTN